MYLKTLIIYKLTYPACNAEYISKTDRCLRVRLDEHSSDHNSAMFEHLHGWEAFKFLFSLNNLPECFNNKADAADFKSHVHQTILNNVTIITCSNNYNQLYFLESLLKLLKNSYCFSFRFNFGRGVASIYARTHGRTAEI